jgi:hypothetical protein
MNAHTQWSVVCLLQMNCSIRRMHGRMQRAAYICVYICVYVYIYVRVAPKQVKSLGLCGSLPGESPLYEAVIPIMRDTTSNIRHHFCAVVCASRDASTRAPRVTLTSTGTAVVATASFLPYLELQLASTVAAADAQSSASRSPRHSVKEVRSKQPRDRR